MRFKAVPEPPADLDALAAVRDALPRVPRPEADCCGRIVDRVDWVEDRETAREWLAFLRALGLVERTRAGAYTRDDTINVVAVGKGGGRAGQESRDGQGSPGGAAAGSRSDRGGAATNPGETAGARSEAHGTGDSGERAGDHGTASANAAPLAARFRERVLGAAEAVDALGEEPRDATAAFAAVADAVPAWERRRTDAWTGVWRERTERLLGWAVLFDLAERRERGYVRAPSGEAGRQRS